MRRVDIKEVAKRAGVSITTVSRALNPKTQKLVKPQTLKKIKRIAKEMGYLPHRIARSLRTGYTRTIGFVNVGINVFSGYRNELTKGILRAVEEVGYDLKLIPHKEFYSLRSILDNAGVDGVITPHAYPGAFPELENELGYLTGPLPLVIVNDYNPKLKVNQVYVDSYKASRKLIEYVLSKKHKNFYVIGGEPDSRDAQERLRAFMDVLRARKIRFTGGKIYNGHFTEEGGYLCAKEILKKEPQFRGVFYCLNDAMAIGALRAIEEANLDCPRDIKVVGFDGIPQTAFTNPPLTTMRFPLEEMGYYAVQIILKIIQGKIKRYIKKEFQAELVVRKSC